MKSEEKDRRKQAGDERRGSRTVDVERLIFTGHAVRQMFARQLSVADIRLVVTHGESIADYPDDAPFPSKLLLGFVQGSPVHVVLAYDGTNSTGYVVTAYRPDSAVWTDDFRVRRSK